MKNALVWSFIFIEYARAPWSHELNEKRYPKSEAEYSEDKFSVKCM